ncbi:MAG: bifunctional oligoribonuclease/PAP phosphatase NrnA [Nitrospirae bacterium]|nr:bifunctional oligoribonuclease/PAP phosphatase NrnA [Nitrospirota bacterium]
MIPPAHLLDFLKREDSFIIAAHLSPDGDALGSALALSMALEKLGKRTLLLCRDSVPEHYLFLPGYERFCTFDTAVSSGIAIQEFRNLILVDCNEIKRTGMERSVLAYLTFQASAVIDHHETEKEFGDFKWVAPDIAATGMMIYYLIKALGIAVTKEMAINLYTALIVDTGNFRFENTSPEVLVVAAALTEAGAPPHLIHRELNESWSEGRFKLFIKLLNTIRIEDGIAITTITKRMFEETSTSPDDTESFVSFPQVMKKIRVAILLREVSENDYKASLRSRGAINVARIAESFGGGGHKNAAGCNIKADIETARAGLIRQVKEQMNEG